MGGGLAVDTGGKHKHFVCVCVCVCVCKMYILLILKAGACGSQYALKN